MALVRGVVELDAIVDRFTKARLPRRHAYRIVCVGFLQTVYAVAQRRRPLRLTVRIDGARCARLRAHRGFEIASSALAACRAWRSRTLIPCPHHQAHHTISTPRPQPSHRRSPPHLAPCRRPHPAPHNHAPNDTTSSTHTPTHRDHHQRERLPVRMYVYAIRPYTACGAHKACTHAHIHPLSVRLRSHAGRHKDIHLCHRARSVGPRR